MSVDETTMCTSKLASLRASALSGGADASSSFVVTKSVGSNVSACGSSSEPVFSIQAHLKNPLSTGERSLAI